MNLRQMNFDDPRHQRASFDAATLPQPAFPIKFWSMKRCYDHIDLRVSSIADVTPFYELLLPALGFTRRVSVEGWLQFEAADGGITEFFGVTESPGHSANENRIAFWAASASEVDRLAEIARRAGASHIEGPMPYEPGYYAVFFEDPCGNRLEICHRAPTTPGAADGMGQNVEG